MQEVSDLYSRASGCGSLAFFIYFDLKAGHYCHEGGCERGNYSEA